MWVSMAKRLKSMLSLRIAMRYARLERKRIIMKEVKVMNTIFIAI